MNGDKGFTYPAALLMIVIVSSSFMVAQKQWSTTMKRERERELFFRAEQIIQAIDSYYLAGSKQYPRSFKVLLKDNRFPGLKRHLRQIYKDPMTDHGDWGVVYDGRGGIKGVFSTSELEPMRKGGFEKKYKTFENKKKYKEWKFIHEPEKEQSS